MFKKFDRTSTSLDFCKATIAHLGPVVRKRNYYSLLRDTHISEDAAKTLSGHPSAYQLQHVELKTLIVYKYCLSYLALYTDSTHLIHKIMNGSKSPAKDLRDYVGQTAGSIPISQRQVARYLCEYKFFDACAHEYPVEALTTDKLYGRATTVTPGGKGGFHMDRRGLYDHRPNFIFNQTDLKMQAQRYMRSQKGSIPYI